MAWAAEGATAVGVVLLAGIVALALLAVFAGGLVLAVLGVAFALPWLASFHPLLALLVVLGVLAGGGAVARQDAVVERLEAIHTSILMRR